jgi:phosphoenolpyruvate carboxykinase (ATP)
MKEFGIKSALSGLEAIELSTSGNVYWNLPSAELIEKSLAAGEGFLTDTGALMCDTGKYTGRAPDDKFIVRDALTENQVWWKEFNHPTTPEVFSNLKTKLIENLKAKNLYVRDVFACASEQYRIKVRVINTLAYHNLFVHNMFIRPSLEGQTSFVPEWTVINDPEFLADPAVDGVKNTNFAIISFTEKCIIIGGTGYTGEIKKGIFSVLNYVLPHEKHVLSMHCSANIGKDGDTALFFGLSGTGKTTLSADPNRGLIGDDEHGWTDYGTFNFEGGCYAKCIDLTEEKEPDIFKAIKPGAILENIEFFEGTNKVNYASAKITENTRVSYPLHYISNAVEPSVGGIPKNVFFLTYDAYGVLPPISRLSNGQAMYHFLSGFTAKVAGTEAGVTEPTLTFSTCFGAPFLPLHPTEYATLLGKKLADSQAKVWMINTGMTGGVYGVGTRMKLSNTRAMITAALNGELDNVDYAPHNVFGMEIPQSCPNVPAEILNPRNTWSDKEAYDAKANQLASEFTKNFEKYASMANDETKAAAPQLMVL